MTYVSEVLCSFQDLRRRFRTQISDSVPRADFPMKISPPVSATKTQSPTSSLREEGLDKFPARSNAVDFTAHAKRPRIWSMARGGIHQNKHQAVSKNGGSSTRVYTIYVLDIPQTCGISWLIQLINYILFLYPILSLCITVTWPILDTLQKNI